MFHGPYRSHRAFVERHPLGRKQAVLTLSGRLPPPPREVHRYRLLHGAPRRQEPTRAAFPWWPDFRDAAVETADDALARAGEVLRDADLPDLDLPAPDRCPPPGGSAGPFPAGRRPAGGPFLPRGERCSPAAG